MVEPSGRTPWRDIFTPPGESRPTLPAPVPESDRQERRETRGLWRRQDSRPARRRRGRRERRRPRREDRHSLHPAIVVLAIFLSVAVSALGIQTYRMYRDRQTTSQVQAYPHGKRPTVSFDWMVEDARRWRQQR